MEFFGRKQELKLLKKSYNSTNFEGILIYGRRRIGKSELIKYSFLDEDCVKIYFECTKTSEESNVKILSILIADVLHIPIPNFSTLRECLKYLFELGKTKKIIIVIDEYPYIRDRIEGCDSIVQNLIDEYNNSSNVKFILSGSYIETMKGLLYEGNPLYNRFDTIINLKQMNYYESSQFYPKFSYEDKLKIYSVFGGIPYYNRFIDDNISVKENIINLICSPNARFSDEIENTLLREISKLNNTNEVFLAISKGCSKFNDILSKSHVSSSPTLVDVLNKLIKMDIITKDFPINDESNKKSIYRINDRLTLFYYRYIFPKLSYFSTMPSDLFFDEFIKNDFETIYVPHEYEEIAKQYLLRKNLEKEIEPILYKIGKYYYDDPKNRVNGEFDVVTLNRNGYDFYEVKFTKEPINDEIVNKKKYQLEQLGLCYNKLGFFSKSGFDIKDKDNYILINLDDVYK